MPMSMEDQERFAAILQARLSDLDREENHSHESRRTVELDQQAVGRLSRMDALGNQAMAKAAQARRQAMGVRIRAALGRIEAGEFGYCADCGEEIGIRRLELDPTVPKCLSCAVG